jgi:hypothetical protein
VSGIFPKKCFIMQGQEGREEHLMPANQIFLVMDAGSPKVAFTTRHEMRAYLKRRRDAFTNPPVYTFWGNQGPSIMTMSSALADG